MFYSIFWLNDRERDKKGRTLEMKQLEGTHTGQADVLTHRRENKAEIPSQRSAALLSPFSTARAPVDMPRVNHKRNC